MLSRRGDVGRGRAAADAVRPSSPAPDDARTTSCWAGISRARARSTRPSPRTSVRSSSTRNRAELRAELADLYARQNNAPAAMVQAEAALAKDPGQRRREPDPRHGLRGVRRPQPAAAPGRRPGDLPREAIARLEKARSDIPDIGLDVVARSALPSERSLRQGGAAASPRRRQPAGVDRCGGAALDRRGERRPSR